MASYREYAIAVTRAAWRLRSIPCAIAARYDAHGKRIVVRFNTGVDVAFVPRDTQGLEDASPDQLADIEISPSGFGIHFPKLDADIYVPTLLKSLPASGDDRAR